MPSSSRRRQALSLTPAVFAVLAIGAVVTAVLVAVVAGNSTAADRAETLAQERRQQAEIVARRVATAVVSADPDRLERLISDAAAALGTGLSVVDREGVVRASTGDNQEGKVVPLWTDGGRTVERLAGEGHREVMVPLHGADGFFGELRLRYPVSSALESEFAVGPGLAALCGGLVLAILTALLANAWNQRVRSVAIAVREGEGEIRGALDPTLTDLTAALRNERADLDSELTQARIGTLQMAREIVHSLEIQGLVPTGHGERVRRLAVGFARFLNLEEADCELLNESCPLLDLGKVTVRPSALRKCEGLDGEERASLRQHPVRGAALLGGVPSLATAAQTIRAQAERYDGGGYPDGIRGTRIPRSSRIASLCSNYDLLTIGSRFGPPMPWPDALDRLREDRGETFDPELFDRFEDFVRESSPRDERRTDVLLTTQGVLPHRITDEPHEVEQLIDDVESWLAACESELEIVPDDGSDLDA